jgi:hypothetical protein
MQATDYPGASPTLRARAHLMTTDENPPSLAEVIRSRMRMLADVAVDLLFLVGWSFVNHYGEILLRRWHSEDQFSFLVLLWCFRISTLMLIVLSLIADLILAFRRIRQRVKPPGGSKSNA